MTNLDSIVKSRDITLPTKATYSEIYGFSSSHVWTWELDHKEGWALNNWCFQTDAGEDSWQSLGEQEDQTNQSQRDSTLNTHWKNWCWSSITLATWCKELTHLKRPWCWERLKAGGEGDDRGWDGWMASPTWWHEFEQAPGVGDGQGSLAYCSPWGRKELDMTEQLNWTECFTNTFFCEMIVDLDIMVSLSNMSWNSNFYKRLTFLIFIIKS